MKKTLFVAAFSSILFSGCATKDFVNERVSKESAVIGANMAKMEAETSAKIAANDRRYEERFTAMQNAQNTISKLAQDALNRANAAHKLAEGKLLAETVLTDDKFKFQFGTAKISKEAEAQLIEMVNKLKADNKNVYIEIQGHTDVIGSSQSNMRLGLERAEAVRQLLHKAGIPLHRINTVSYGETQPVNPGFSRAAHAQNRRVVIMVLA